MSPKSEKNVGGKPRRKSGPRAGVPDYPRHPVEKALRIPKAILNQNAGKSCSDKESARFSGVGYHGPYKVELGSSIKYGFLNRPAAGTVEVTDLAKKAIRPQRETDRIEALRQGVLKAPKISEVYQHYRGENLPDDEFFGNALTDTFGIPPEKRGEFKSIFLESLTEANLLEKHGDKVRVIDVSKGSPVQSDTAATLTKLGKEAKVSEGESCFVMMSFGAPVGGYYTTIYEPAIAKAGLRAVRADDDMFTTGKIIDQIFSGITSARILVAELTGRNPNVFYELGLAHALEKPVVLVSSNEQDVPFDIHHIRVIYYDVKDPFWGAKLIDKIAEISCPP